MIFITGDCHSDFERFRSDRFPFQENMTKNDLVIICGDFGGIWHVKPDDPVENRKLDFLSSRPFTTLFVCGNHENFDRLDRYPVEEWSGGKIHVIRESVFHLMRGQIFTLEGKKFFTFGGASSHDIQGGILNPGAADFMEQYNKAKKGSLPFRINHVSWWDRELPSEDEMSEGLANLKIHHYSVDYMITHCCSANTLALLSGGRYKPDRASLYLETIRQKCSYRHWFFGHYHANRQISEKETLLYDQIIRIL